ncbi:anthrone oxygenase family protein [Streptomyces johnsoniae]|uniref:Anthrone oxygenase family protein n=1 Tax=Streptomyces johnsoniae TaxID=3075532 RepID=A0ABU2S0A5_9ACTN|nr:anthrone oxygenase family protein [Streptomyces sp. DSM 41886]MDT0442392.1 anthrone oxygenase family protein [Streptomyces sp. DSM 41886]
MTILAVFAAAVTLVAAAAVTGVFFAFSVSVMPGLNAVGPGEAVRAMQSINAKILNPAFLGAFVGAPIAAALTGALLLLLDHRAAGLAFLAAAVVYVLGAFLPTAAVNVPMNDALAAVGSPEDPHRARPRLGRLRAAVDPLEHAARRLRRRGTAAGGARCVPVGQRRVVSGIRHPASGERRGRCSPHPYAGPDTTDATDATDATDTNTAAAAA